MDKAAMCRDIRSEVELVLDGYMTLDSGREVSLERERESDSVIIARMEVVPEGLLSYFSCSFREGHVSQSW